MVDLYDQNGDRFRCYTVRQFAHLYGVTDRSIYNWMEYGLPNIDMGHDEGGTILIPAKDARTWVREMARKKGIRI